MTRLIKYAHLCLIIFFLILCTQLTACIQITVGPSSSTTTAPTPSGTQASDQERQIARAVFDAINNDRAANRLSALQWSDQLARSARQHNSAMMAANSLAHQVSGEPELGEREKQQGVQWLQAAENIGYTSDMSENGAMSLHKAMMAEKPPDDGHRKNILDTQNTILGVDILFDTTHGKLWLTEDFARV